jgi:hypothetical protein
MEIDELRADLDRALMKMLNGTCAGASDYTVAILMLGAILNDLALPTEHELTHYSVFARIIAARDRMRQSGDIENLDRMKAEVRGAMRGAVNRIGELARRKLNSKRTTMVN